jgi:membrane fusion protein (multidrug efflux system)
MNSAVPAASVSGIVQPEPSPTPLHERWRRPLLILGVVVVAAGTLYFWLTGGRYMSTEDAYVQAARTSISSNVSGKVVAIAVQDNQRVHRGDLLFQLEDKVYRIAVDAARANLGSARLTVEANKAAYRQHMADVAAQNDALEFRQKEFTRLQHLQATGNVSQTQFDQARHDQEDARQKVISAQHQADSTLAMLGGDPDIDPAAHPTVQAAQAELARAELNLSYTRVAAPDDGIVAKVELLHVGDYVVASSPVFALISTADMWVEANFKESQLTHMHEGQLATVKIDTYPGQDFHARIASISPGTGSQFSLLPPENATGNWVKVVQRVPVRVEFTDNNASVTLHSGLSASVTVDTGYQRKLFGIQRE